ncbi:MAG TPA: hypothetical protein VK250_02940 [Nitrososphaeraceae archaeon]|nr:hypothetical protein [Nitrososphaeraceae archaeon]
MRKIVSTVELFTEEDLIFLERVGLEVSDFTDKQIREIKQPSPDAHEERIKACMDMKNTNFIAGDIECVTWTLSAEASYRLAQWAIQQTLDE